MSEVQWSDGFGRVKWGCVEVYLRNSSRIRRIERALGFSSVFESGAVFVAEWVCNFAV